MRRKRFGRSRRRKLEKSVRMSLAAARASENTVLMHVGNRETKLDGE